MGRRVNSSVVVDYTSLCLYLYSSTTILTVSGASTTSEVQDEPQYAELTEPPNPIYTEPTVTLQEPSSNAIPQGHTASSNAPSPDALSEGPSQGYAQPNTSPRMASVNNPNYFYTEPYMETEVKSGFIMCT